MRTRLDEIVDEESERWVALMRPEPFGGDQRVVAERIAARAFRHGVEQTETAYDSMRRWPVVQPAPVEEKKRHGCSLIWCGKGPDHAVHTDQQGTPATFHPYRHLESYCVECGGKDVRDRRKGERRKNTRAEFLGSINGVYGGLYAGPNGGILANRRSGKDRRKP